MQNSIESDTGFNLLRQNVIHLNEHCMYNMFRRWMRQLTYRYIWKIIKKTFYFKTKLSQENLVFLNSKIGAFNQDFNQRYFFKLEISE